jgi:hypothetical protein
VAGITGAGVATGVLDIAGAGVVSAIGVAVGEASAKLGAIPATTKTAVARTARENCFKLMSSSRLVGPVKGVCALSRFSDALCRK